MWLWGFGHKITLPLTSLFLLKENKLSVLLEARTPLLTSLSTSLEHLNYCDFELCLVHVDADATKRRPRGGGVLHIFREQFI